MERTTATTRPGRLGIGALTTTRVLSGVIAALVLVQGALGGSFLSGIAGALDAHRTVALQVLSLLGLAVVVTAAVAVRRNRWALPVSSVGLLGLGVQIVMGFEGRLSVHVPLGIALFGVYLTMALVLRDKTSKEETT